MTAAPDPALLARIAPTELRPGEDPVTRFVREARLVQTAVEVTTRDRLAAAVTQALRAEGARRVAVAADLAPLRYEMAARLREAGIEAVRYEDVAPDRDAVRDLDATVTGCMAAVAATGSIVTGGAAGRGGALVAPVHVCVVERSRLFDGLLALLRALPDLGAASAIALQTGPSRTADIEKTLILGMHGPKAVHVVVVVDAPATPAP